MKKLLKASMVVLGMVLGKEVFAGYDFSISASAGTLTSTINGTATFCKVVENTGDVVDNYLLSATNTITGFITSFWSVSPLGTAIGQIIETGNLPPGGTKTIFVKVYVPSDAYVGSINTTYVTIQSQGNPTIKATEIDKTNVGVWWMFRNSLEHTGQSPYNGPNNPGLKWSYTTGGQVHSSPAIAQDGTIYVGADDKKLYSIHPDGSLKWSYLTGGQVQSSPAIAQDGTIYVGSFDYNFYALNPDGSLKWSYTTGAGVLSSPAIAQDGTIYVGSNDKNLYAINPNGTLKWSYTTGSSVYSSPAIAQDGTIYFGSLDNNLYAINPDGGLKWSYTTGSVVRSSPAIAQDGTIYVGSLDKKLYSIHPDGTLKWSYTTGGWVLSSPAIAADGTIYVGSYDGKLYSIHPDGSFKWSYTTGGWVYSSPAIAQDGTVYVGSYDGKLYSIHPDGSPKWSYTTGGGVWSSPAIAQDGTIYVGSFDNKLYAITETNYGLSVSQEYGTLTSCINGTATFYKVVENTGDVVDNYLLSATNTITGFITSFWSVSPLGTATGQIIETGNLPPGGTKTIFVKVYVPSDAYVGSINTTYVTIQSQGNPAIKATEIDKTNVGVWWMFRNSLEHTGQSPYNGPNNPRLKWSYTTGDYVFSSPAIAQDGTIYVGSYDNKLYAINPDGSLKWSYTTGSAIESSPAIAQDGTIYVGSYDKNLYAINSDGSLKWSYTTGDCVSSSPAIAQDGTIYVGSYYDDKKLYAINPDGTLAWSYTTGGGVWSSPAISNNGTIYVGSEDNKLYSIHPDGTLAWSYTTGGPVPFSSPAIAQDGTIYVGSYDNKLYAINPDGSLKWSYTTGSAIESSPAIAQDGTIYVGSEDCKLYAINPDGSLKWSYTTGSVVYSSPAIAQDGTIYVGSLDHKLYAINPDGSLKWSYTTGSCVFSSPAIAQDGTIYVGSYDNKLHAITNDLRIKTSPSSATIGSIVRVEGQGFAANTQVCIDFGTAQTITTAITNINGTFSCTFITDTQPMGTKVITATDSEGNLATTTFFLKPTPFLGFSPEYQMILQGAQGTVSLTVSDIFQFFGCEAYLLFNPNILNVSTITQGSFIPDGWLTSSFDNTSGTINVACGLNMGASPVSGSGTLAHIIFSAIGTKTQVLSYETNPPRDTLLMDMDGKIIFNIGTASIEVPPVSYIKITPSPATVCITEEQIFSCQGYTFDGREIPGLSYTWSLEGGIGTISTTIGTQTIFIAGRNPGIATLSVSSSGISTHTLISVIFSTATVTGRVIIDTGNGFLKLASIIVRLTEDSTGQTKITETNPDSSFIFSNLIPGTYTLFADTTGASPATRTGIFVLTNQTTELGTITLLGGDSDNDGRVRILDFYNLYFACPSIEGDSNYNLEVDFDHDKDVDLSDFAILYRNFFRGKGLKVSSICSNNAKARFILSSSFKELKPGDRFDCLLEITGIDSLMGLEASLSFNREIIEIIEIKQEGFGWSASNLEEGLITFGINLGSLYISGSSKIARITFVVKKEGKTKITINDAIIIDKNKNIIPFSSDSLEIEVRGIPSYSSLGQSFPNPAIKGCWIPFQLASDSDVVLEVYNILGQRVKTIYLGQRNAGFYVRAQEGSAIFWDQRNDKGEGVSSGLYFYKLKAGNFSQTKALAVK